MARYKKWLDIDVVTAARERVSHIFDVFDSVVVQFSGGKDSLVCLHIVREEAERRGQLPVEVVFRDEELIPECVVDFVDEYRQKSWVNLRWYAIPLQSSKYILGRPLDMTQWDPDREWLRPKPEWAITHVDGVEVGEQTHLDEALAQPYPGKVAFVTGIRASESLVRYRSVVNKLNENYINLPQDADPRMRVRMAKPIYDWEETDVFKWLHDQQIPWCTVYEAQNLTGNNLRVSTPLHSESARRLHYWAAQDPVFYERLMDLFPEMQVQARYSADVDPTKHWRPYAAEGWPGVQRYIDEQVTDSHAKELAERRLREFMANSRTNPEGYTPELLLKSIVSGAIKRVLMPKRTRENPENRLKAAAQRAEMEEKSAVAG